MNPPIDPPGICSIASSRPHSATIQRLQQICLRDNLKKYKHNTSTEEVCNSRVLQAEGTWNSSTSNFEL